MRIKITAECEVEAEDYMKGFVKSDLPELLHHLRMQDGEHAFDVLTDKAGRDHRASNFKITVEPLP